MASHEQDSDSQPDRAAPGEENGPGPAPAQLWHIPPTVLPADDEQPQAQQIPAPPVASPPSAPQPSPGYHSPSPAEPWQTADSTVSLPLHSPQRRHTMWLVAAGVVLVLLIGTGVGAAVWLRPAEPARESVGAATVAASPAPSDDSALQPGNLASASASHAPAPTSSKSAAAPVDGSLIASDTFDAPGNPDSTRWDAYQSTAANGSVWSPDQVRVKDGELQIVGKGTNPTGAGNLSGGLCWCGKDGNQTYGKWQVRAKFDAGSGYGQIMGLWPISDKSIDGHITLFSVIMPDRRSSNGFVDSGTTPAVQVPVHGDFTAWHTFTLEWRETFVRMSVDSTVFYDSAKVIGPVAISHLPMHFYLQQPAGPRDGVPPANAQTPAEVISHVDWIRVYH